MAFKMKGMNHGEGTGSAYNKIPMHGTSIRDLSNLSYDERRDYKAWKHRERQAGRSGREHDHSYEAYLASLNKPKKERVPGQGWQKVKDFFSNIRLGDGGKKLKPTTIAKQELYQASLDKPSSFTKSTRKKK